MGKLGEAAIEPDHDADRLAGDEFDLGEIEDHQPSVLFIDELEELGLNRFQLHGIHERGDAKLNHRGFVDLREEIFRGH